MARLKRSPAQNTLRGFANTPFTPSDSGRHISPGLTTNLPSNNPFRNRAVSPANSLPSPVTATFGNVPNTASERPTSRNPFLDQSEKKYSTTAQVRSTSPEQGASGMAGRMSPSKPALTGHAVELFVGSPRDITSYICIYDLEIRTISLSTMAHQEAVCHLKACLHRTAVARHEQKLYLLDLKTSLHDQDMTLPDIILHARMKKAISGPVLA